MLSWNVASSVSEDSGGTSPDDDKALTTHREDVEKVNAMHFTSDEQGLLLAVAVGFVTCVALLHLTEAAVLAARLRAWMPLWWSGLLLIATVVFLAWRIGVDLSHGVRFADLLVIFGVQLGLLVCLPSRWLSRRKCQWDRKRAQLELQAERWRQAADPQQRSRMVYPGPFDRLDSRRAGVGPRVR